MSQYERNFKGVWIPADVWLNTDLSIQEKVMLVEIDSLHACPERGCWAGNDHFAKFFGLSKSRVSEVITSLTKKGYLRVDYQRKGKQIVERNIFISSTFGKSTTPFGNGGEPLRKTEEPPSGNAKGNNTKINNTVKSKNTRSIAKKTATNPAQPKPESNPDLFDELWQHYPKREGSNPKNRAKQNFNARIKEGHTPDVMAQGLKRYIEFCKAKGQTGTSFVMQAQRFFGTALEFLNDWAVSKSQIAQAQDRAREWQDQYGSAYDDNTEF